MGSVVINYLAIRVGGVCVVVVVVDDGAGGGGGVGGRGGFVSLENNNFGPSQG